MRNLKRALSLGLTAAMISGLMVMGSSAASYADVADTDNVEAIEVLQAVGIMVGDENGDFNPDQNVTRNEMAVVMSNLMEYNVASYANTSPFTDVPSWAEPYVAACWTNGITAGTSATTYGGSDNVTTSQAALMLMKALGYFQYSQDFGQDWQLATATKGNDIDLFNGVDSGLREAMTRNDLAQLVLNTLESGTVSASTSGSITVGGVTIATDVQYNYVTSNAGYAKSISGALSTDANSDAGRPIVELGEDLYQGDLAKAKDHDAFGRPAAIWAYKDNEIGTYVDDRTQTWTTKVSERDLYRAAGTAAVNDYEWNYWIDGERYTMDGSKLDRNDTDRWQTTGNGVLTEMFVDTVAETVDVTVIHTYVAEVSRVEANDDDNDYTVTVNLKTRPAGVGVNREFSTEEEFARGDIVVVNIADGNIEAISLAETVEGTVGGVKDNDYLRIDGTRYDYNYAYTTDTVLQGYTTENRGLYDLENSVPANPGAGDEVILYLDTNGCLVAVAEAGEVAEDYIYVKGIHQAYGDNSAKIVKYDGTEETIDIDEVDGNDEPAIARDGAGNISPYTVTEQLGLGVYKYSRSGSAYDLSSSEDADPEFTKAYMDKVKIENGRARMVEEDGTASYYVDSNTVFVDAWNNTSYIGYNNVPTMSDVEGWVVYDGDNTVADVVFIINDVQYELDNDNFFLVISSGAEEEYNEKGNVWNYTGYINGEETTLTFANEEDLDVGVYKITKTDSDGNVTDVEEVLDADDLLRNFGRNTTAYATYAKGQSLTVANAVVSDKSVENVADANVRFTYLSDESLVVVAYLNDENDDVKTVAIGDLGDINVAENAADRDEETSAVYILNVDDVDEAAPVAKLILVVNPDPTGDESPVGPGVVTPGTVVTPLSVNESALAITGEVYGNASLNDVRTATGNALIAEGWTVLEYTASSDNTDDFTVSVRASKDGTTKTFNATLDKVLTVYVNDKAVEIVPSSGGNYTIATDVKDTNYAVIDSAAGTGFIWSVDKGQSWTYADKSTGKSGTIADNLYVETGYVEVTGDKDDIDYAPVGESLRVPTKSDLTGQGTGLKYTIDGVDKYVAYGDVIPASEVTDDIVLDQNYVKVDVMVSAAGWELDENAADTTTFIEVAAAQSITINLINDTKPAGSSVTTTDTHYTITGGVIVGETDVTSGTYNAADGKAELTISGLNASTYTGDITVEITAVVVA